MSTLRGMQQDKASLGVASAFSSNPGHTLQLTQQLLNDKELVDVAIPWEQGLAVYELPHDAPHRPHVHLLAIVAAAKQQLWSPVPPAPQPR